MQINKKLFNFVLNRPGLLNFLLKATNFESVPFLQKKRNELIAKSIEGIYSAGENLSSAEERILELEQKQVGVILNYAMEAAGQEGIHRMKKEYGKIVQCLKAHSLSCVALKPTALVPIEKLTYLCELMKNENYKQIDLDKFFENPEIAKIAEPFSELSKHAIDAGTRILIDAEQSNLQPGVDILSLYLMKTFNSREKSTIYNTYQLYLKDSHERLKVHKLWLEKKNCRFAAKLVRGAYLSYEIMAKYESHPNYVIYDTKKEVDQSYNSAVEALILNGESSLIVATHNLDSLKLLTSLVKKGINEFEYAFLMGFGDKTTAFAKELRCLEYVPYGPSDVKVPYLLRRLEENITIYSN